MRHMDRFALHFDGQLCTKSLWYWKDSVGALFALNWRQQNPQAVACVYLDAGLRFVRELARGSGQSPEVRR